MKRVVVGLVMVLSALEGIAQRSSVDQDQIVALRLSLGLLEKGYSLVGTGIDTLQRLQSGEYSLHNNYYSSLYQVNPVVAGSPEVKEILSLQASLSGRVHNATGRALEAEADADIQVLQQVLEPGRFSMTDDQRLAYIHALDLRAKERLRMVLN
jgi:hypothetical protein